MKISIAGDLFSRFPGYRRLVAVASGIYNAPENPELMRQLQDTENACRENSDLQPSPSAHPRITAWGKALTAMGADRRARSSVESLVLKVQGGSDIAFRSTLVALVNHLSLKHLVPCGATDLDLLVGDIALVEADGSEPFNGPEGPERPTPGEVILRDGDKVILRRWVWRQDQTTMVTEDTRNVVIHVDLMPEVDAEDETAIRDDLTALLEAHCPGKVRILTLSESEPEAEIELFEPGGADVQHLEKRGLIQSILDRAGDLLNDTGDFATWTLWDFIYRGVIERVIVRDAFLKLLEGDKAVKIYQGFDATSASLHVGHLLGLRVLRWFQLQGHEVIFLVGDATGMVGDPTDKSKQRSLLTEEQVLRNMANWKEQAARILDFDEDNNGVRFLRNSSWLHKLTLKDLTPLMSKITIQRLLERDMFQDRIGRGDPLFFIETIYPLLQGYDSVVMDVNAELGGSDQLYNMLVGRDLVKAYAGKEKHVLTHPLLPGTDGRKMGKSEGNAITFTEEPFKMFDGLMQVRDELMLQYFRWLTDLSWSELLEAEKEAKRDPLALKEKLAINVMTQIRGRDEAEKAHAEFIRVRRKGEKPKEIPEVILASADFPEGKAWAPALLAGTTPPILASRGEARRMIKNRGVRVNDETLTSHDVEFPLSDMEGSLIQIGKKRIYRIKVR